MEVKTRGPGPQAPLEAIGPGQKGRIRRAAEAWIHAHPGVGSEFRFDAVGVALGPGHGEGPGSGEPRISHVPNAWYGDP